MRSSFQKENKSFYKSEVKYRKKKKGELRQKDAEKDEVSWKSFASLGKDDNLQLDAD